MLKKILVEINYFQKTIFFLEKCYSCINYSLSYSDVQNPHSSFMLKSYTYDKVTTIGFLVLHKARGFSVAKRAACGIMLVD